ncbi:hypothetical protein N752_28120 [Desulforamulus aquiferis]|nr:ATP-binding protein [Desulforamulus aquiferis]RYD01841.1 hypothetical protein N752_28120 [Desulforamulus aquiferis]
MHWDCNKTYPVVTIEISDNRAYFSGIDIDMDTYTIKCKGDQLSSCKVEVFTSTLQLINMPAQDVNTLTIIDKPNYISLVLTNDSDWLDRRDIVLTGLGQFMPSDVSYSFLDESLAIKELIYRHGESKTLEFKEMVNDRLLQTIVAFANTEGGKIILGVSDDGNIVGAKLEGIKEQIQNKIETHITSCPNVNYFSYKIDGKYILVIEVHEGADKPYSIDLHSNKPQFYVRRDGSNRLAKPYDIKQMFNKYSENTTR